TVAHEHQRHAHQARAVRIDEVRKHGLVATLQPGDDLGVGQGQLSGYCHRGILACPADRPQMSDTIAGMDSTELRALQAPLKERYRAEPDAAVVTLKAEGSLDHERVACSVATGRALVDAGLHPASGGTGMLACSGDMLLEALVACAGVTLSSVATALGINVSGSVRAEGDLDFRG